MTFFERTHARTSNLHYQGLNYYGRRIIIDASEPTPGSFEIVAMWPDGDEVETVTADTLEAATAEYNRMVEFHTTGKAPGMYTREDWQRDRSFNASAGQEIAPEIYDEMLDALPPVSLSRVLKAQGKRGFMMGEPSDFDPDTGKLRYLAFTQRNGHFFYEGLFSR